MHAHTIMFAFTLLVPITPLMGQPLVETHEAATLSACWEALPAPQPVDIFLDGASGPAALLMVSLLPPEDGTLPDSFFDVFVTVDPEGSAHFQADITPLLPFEPDRSVWLTAVFEHEGELVRTMPAALLFGGTSQEILDFDWAPDGGYAMAFGGLMGQWLPEGFTPVNGRELRTGEVVTEQWSSRGVHIRTENANPGHPHKAIIFDSSNPTGGDGDLVTPGYGPDNTVAEGKLLIIAEDDVDANGDGLVDDPDDEAAGGIIRVTFDDPVVVCSLKIIDLDNVKDSVVRFYDSERLRQTFPFTSKGDNDATRLEMFCYDTRRLEINLGGSGGIAYLGLLPCPTRVDFDWSTFGVPTGLAAGEIMTDQLAGLGISVEAVNASPGLPNKAILFDTKFPTGDDDDLATPGPGIGNDMPLRHALIIAEDDVDADLDGYVDDPDDAANGGVISMDFSFDRWIRSATLIDIEPPEFSWMEMYDENGVMIATIPIVALGDNSVQEVPINVQGVRRFELHLDGSGALARLDFCPPPALP